MDAKVINATDKVDQLREMFDALGVLSTAVKAGAIDDQTVAERKVQIEALGKRLETLKADEASLVADIEQHRKDDAAATAEAAAMAKRTLEEASAKAASLLDAAQKGVARLEADAAAERNEALETHRAQMNEKQAMLADLNRQIDEAANKLSDVNVECAEVEKRTADLRAAAAAILTPAA